VTCTDAVEPVSLIGKLYYIHHPPRHAAPGRASQSTPPFDVSCSKETIFFGQQSARSHLSCTELKFVFARRSFTLPMARDIHREVQGVQRACISGCGIQQAGITCSGQKSPPSCRVQSNFLQAFPDGGFNPVHLERAKEVESNFAFWAYKAHVGIGISPVFVAFAHTCTRLGEVIPAHIRRPRIRFGLSRVTSVGAMPLRGPCI